MNGVIAFISVILACIVVAFAMMGLVYLDNRLQKKRRDEYFSNLKQCIVDAFTTLENR